MSDTTAALRMALAAMVHDDSFLLPEVIRDWIRARLTERTYGPGRHEAIARFLLEWGTHTDPTGQLTATLQALLDGTPTHAPGMGGLHILATHLSAEVRKQAAALNKS